MKGKKTTRRALVMSLLSLLLCCSMLVGTTFAWFTDSVTSGKNKIIAGNLDIELEYSKDMAEGSWASVEKAENLFKKDTLWEPGHTEVVYLRLSNQGTLDLKYQFKMHFEETEGTNVFDETFKLSQFLKYDIVDVEAPYADRNAARKAVEASAETLAYYAVSGQMSGKTGDKTETKTMALVVYMPEEVDNKANYKTGTEAPVIDLYLSLFATQLVSEEDSFGSDYDASATWMVTNEDELKAALKSGGIVMLANSIQLTEAMEIPSGVAVKLDMNGNTLSNPASYILENKGNLTVDGNGTFEGLGIIRSKEGKITVNNGNFYASSRWQDSVYQHTLKAENTTVVINGGTFDATKNGQTNAMFNASTGGTITINGGTFKNVAGALGAYDPYIFTYENNGKLIVNDGTFYGGWRFNGETASTDIYGGNFTVGFDGQSFHANSTHVVTVYGGTFTKGTKLADKLSDVVAAGYKAVENTDGSYTVLPGENTTQLSDGLYFDNNDTYYVTNGNGLTSFAAEVNKGLEYEGNTFAGQNVKLSNNIDLAGAEWTPIGNFGLSSKQFSGTFDGQGHTVSNFQITQKSPDREGKNRSPEGFFGNVNGTVKNLTIANATVKVTNDGRFVGGIIGRLNGGLVENCQLVDSHVEGSAWQIGGIVGQANTGTISNCIVENTTVVGTAGVAAVAGFQMDAKETTIENCAVKGCAIEQKGSYGEGYDDMFAAVIGCVNSSGATVNINGCTVENTTVKGENSSAIFGYIEEGAKVYVDGFAVIADGLTQKAVEYNVFNANGLMTLHDMMADETAGRDVVVNLMADIDMTGKTWTPVDSQADKKFELAEINGNGHTVSNLTVNGQAMFWRLAGFGDVVIKDITFDKATVNSNGSINTAIITGHTYQNVLLDNVDVKNSSITGGYKVAPLIATVYNEGSSTITASLKDCDVSDTTVTATLYDFCTAGMVAFVYEGDNDKVEFENCTVTDVKLYAPAVYTSHAWVYVNDADTDDCFNEVEGVTVSGCTFENK